MRLHQRANDQLRPITITRHYTKHAEGSVLVEFGDTKVLCTASVAKGRPRWMKDEAKQRGWVTAEYGMLPRSTGDRMNREATQGKQGGRTLEIQRLIARSLRAVVDLYKLGDYTITVDCDVIQADGGTRTASVTGACVALVDAMSYMLQKKMIPHDPFLELVAAVSVGIHNGTPILDLEYTEDSTAETDMNVVMTAQGQFIEVQGTAESKSFSKHELDQMLVIAEKGIAELIKLQKMSLGMK